MAALKSSHHYLRRAHPPSDEHLEYPDVDTNPKIATSSTPEPSQITSEGIYEALWNESKEYKMESQKELSLWLTKLKGRLDSPSQRKDYFDWVKSNKFKARTYTLNLNELLINLREANWVVGNRYLRHLNSLLSYSVTAATNSITDLKRTYKSYKLGLQIDGRPIARIQSEPEEYADKGIVVNSGSVLAIRYHPRMDDSVKTEPPKTTMLFVPLGQIFAQIKPDEWVQTGLVLIAEIRKDGKAGSLYMVFPPRGHGDDDSEACIPPVAADDEERAHFTLAKLEDELALLDVPSGSSVSSEIVATIVSDSPVEMFETGSMVAGKPDIAFAFALLPGD